jgi:hypothetical protein
MCAIRYVDVDLFDLDRRFGREFMERIHVHSALFEINKIASLRPHVLDLGRYAHHHTAALESLWNDIFTNVWAQWRYENDIPDAIPPVWASKPVSSNPVPARRDLDAQQVLLLSGGGKDSLVSMRLLERGNIPFAILSYSSSVYGRSVHQFALTEQLGSEVATFRHRQIVIDDFFDSPVIELYGRELGVKTITSAETPSSIFGVLPILLDRGYHSVVACHEASANTGNLIWEKTGKEVNHQWGKSVVAERLIDDYVRAELVEDSNFFSILMPIHDVAIFSLLRQDLDMVPAAHSCNMKKPWCMRCPKCSYVWLGYRAHLPDEDVLAIFPHDLIELPENQKYFQDMVGLGKHTPFECIGQIEESRLALILCLERGLLGPRGRALAARLPPLDLKSVLDQFLRVNAEHSRLPENIAATVLPQMFAAVDEARSRIEATLGRGTSKSVLQ